MGRADLPRRREKHTPSPRVTPRVRVSHLAADAKLTEMLRKVDMLPFVQSKEGGLGMALSAGGVNLRCPPPVARGAAR